MPKNKGSGGKKVTRGKGDTNEKRELIFKEDGQEYGQVLTMLGNGRAQVSGGKKTFKPKTVTNGHCVCEPGVWIHSGFPGQKSERQDGIIELFC